MAKNISLIIVHWNTPKALNNLLNKLGSSKNIEVIVVDNSSSNPIGWVKNKYSDVLLITNKTNNGYAKACNQGAKKAKGDWLIFLNPDVEIGKDQINELLSYALEKNLSALCPKTEGLDYNKPIPSSFSLLAEFTPLKHIIPLRLFKKRTLFGGCLLIKKNVLKTLGGWDEDFFLWFEDSDLTKRLIDNKYKIGIAPIIIKHLGGYSFRLIGEKKKKELFFNSMQIYAKKHFCCFGKLIVWILKKRYLKE